MPNIQIGNKVAYFSDDMPIEEIEAAIRELEISQLPKGLPQQTTIEPAFAMAGGLAGEVAGGLSGLVRTGTNLLLGEGVEKSMQRGAETVESVSGKIQELTRPRTQYGARGAMALSEALEPVATGFEELSKKTGDVAFEKTKSPAMGALGYTAPTAVLEALGLSGLRRVMPNVQFIDAAGNPTPELLNALRGMGLSWSDLESAAVARIPNAPKRQIHGLPALEESLAPVRAEQIRAGGSEAALAPLMLQESGRTAKDPLAQQAIKQWDDAGLVQAVKTATPATRQAMLQMLDLRQRITGNKRLAQTQRPTDIPGQAAVARVNYLRDVAKQARTQLNEIANKDLAGKPINVQPVLESLTEALGNLRVGITRSDEGLPRPVFEESLISKNPSAKRAIKDLFDLLSEGGAPDALRFHNLKRQLDELIDYRKSQQGGLTDSGRNVLKTVRSALNQQLRLVDENYAKVNDVLSETLSVFDDLDSVSGKRTDIFAPDASTKIGQELRKLFSNYGVRTDLMNTVQMLDEVSAKYGGRFDDSVMDLAMFANALDTRFGPVAETSFKGEIASAMKGAQADEMAKRAAEQGFTRAMIDKIMESYQSMRGVSEDQAYLTMEQLLKRNGQ